MDERTEQKLTAELPDTARVLDVGGGAYPFRRADYVLDGLSYDERGALCLGARPGERFTRDSWVQWDLCDRRPWPFADKFFDFAVCSHVLEDVRDPVWVCAELCRVAKAGYIETPSRALEQSLGVEHPLYAGYYHHRWLVSHDKNGLILRHKPHSLHALRGAIVAKVGVLRAINPAHAAMSFTWRDTFSCREARSFDEAEVNRELCETAREWRPRPDLTISRGGSLRSILRRALYYFRLRVSRP